MSLQRKTLCEHVDIDYEAARPVFKEFARTAARIDRTGVVDYDHSPSDWIREAVDAAVKLSHRD